MPKLLPPLIGESLRRSQGLEIASNLLPNRSGFGFDHRVMEQVVLAEALSLRYGTYTAVNKVTLAISRGDCFGLLGPNGAGKSTFIRLLYGARLRDEGELLVLGMDPQISPRQLKKRIGVVPQENCLDDHLSVEENLRIFGAYHGLYGTAFRIRVEELLKFMSLDAKRDAGVKQLSGGMQRRLAFVRALLHRPDFLILDEPTTGLDPAVRQLLWEKVHELNREGVTILLTTHYMEEAQKLCRNVAIMNEGSLATEGRPGDLIQKHVPGFVAIFDRKSLEARVSEAALKTRFDISFSLEPIQILIRAPNLETLLNLAKEWQTEPLMIRPSNLEDVFLKISGKDLDRYA